MHCAPPTVAEARALIAEHLSDHYEFYGEEAGVRIARKHLGWYTEGLPGSLEFRAEANAATTVIAQTEAVRRFFARLADVGEWMPRQNGAVDGTAKHTVGPSTQISGAKR